MPIISVIEISCTVVIKTKQNVKLGSITEYHQYCFQPS